MLLEPRPEGLEGASLPLTRGECLRGSRSNMCQGPEVGVYLACLRRMTRKQEGGWWDKRAVRRDTYLGTLTVYKALH